MNVQREAPVEQIDEFRWDEGRKIITRDVHGVSGLMNFTHLKILSSESPTAMHYHRNTVEIYCVVKGSRDNRLVLDGRIEDHHYIGGEAFVVFPEEYHSTGSNARQSPCEAYAIQLNLEEKDDFLGLNARKGRELCRRIAGLQNRHLRMNPEDLSFLREAFDRFSTFDQQERDEGLMHLVCFLYRFLKFPPTQTTLRSRENSNIQNALQYIHANIAEPLPLETLARLTGYSLSHFKAKFRDETGQTPAFYIASLKIEQAKKALLTSDQSVTDIAYSLGWSTGNYFCTVFKKMTGISPLQYRRSNR